MRPNRLVARAYLFRGTKLWLVTRAALSGAFILAGDDPLRLSAAAIAGILLLSISLGYLDTRIHRESVLLGNLGVSPLSLGALFAAPALAGEILLWAFATVAA